MSGENLLWLVSFCLVLCVLDASPVISKSNVKKILESRAEKEPIENLRLRRSFNSAFSSSFGSSGLSYSSPSSVSSFLISGSSYSLPTSSSSFGNSGLSYSSPTSSSLFGNSGFSYSSPTLSSSFGNSGSNFDSPIFSSSSSSSSSFSSSYNNDLPFESSVFSSSSGNKWPTGESFSFTGNTGSAGQFSPFSAFSSSSSSSADKKFPYDLEKPELTQLYGQNVVQLDHMKRPLDSSGGVSGNSLAIPPTGYEAQHEGVLATLEDRSKALIHKGKGFGDESDSVVVYNPKMSSHWETMKTVDVGGKGISVGDLQKVSDNGKRWEYFDNCQDAADRQMKLGEQSN